MEGEGARRRRPGGEPARAPRAGPALPPPLYPAHRRAPAGRHPVAGVAGWAARRADRPVPRGGRHGYLGSRTSLERLTMCRNIKTLANFEPPATDDEIHASALQFVRKLSGSTNPSKANEAVFAAAVEDVAAIARRLVDSLETHAPPRNREVEAQKARERAAK